MSRSSKKGPFTNEKLMVKVFKVKDSNDRSPIKTWARNSSITPDMVGLFFDVHNGKKFIQVYITESMVGHKLGEFAPTRTFRAHSSKKVLKGAEGDGAKSPSH
ncbi:30S ribosomal protein S19 [candidate division WWE3 bacterium RIFCSPLOWO2_01_FULL_39_13]|uniref:Small ribosomal subunit protein uS19 n=1 Tax=candidate division WWE3 bacterium RIFCSPLOWO2_01_FULL_39_13 TaxID=1802624 RepID=A0A1F4V6E1_UNCKA|nr:MAG: 30S ribosomal protein S19 [candidate division WWE3 bacterium RIFCSPLOWO2_01_FULL_39_13]